LIFNAFFHRHGWLCDAPSIASVATFAFDHPPIIIANIKPLSNRSAEGYEAYVVRLRDMKRIIKIGSVE